MEVRSRVCWRRASCVDSPVMDHAGNISRRSRDSAGRRRRFRFSDRAGWGDAALCARHLNATGLAVDYRDNLCLVAARGQGLSRGEEWLGGCLRRRNGLATGLAFDADQNLYVGDRSGTIFKIAPDRQIFVFATLEPSVAAYHLAFGPDGTLYVTGRQPRVMTRCTPSTGTAEIGVLHRGLGRPQGVAVDLAGNVYVAGSLRGRRGVAMISPQGDACLAVAGPGIVGFSFVRAEALSGDRTPSIYHVALGVEGWRLV